MELEEDLWRTRAYRAKAFAKHGDLFQSILPSYIYRLGEMVPLDLFDVHWAYNGECLNCGLSQKEVLERELGDFNESVLGVRPKDLEPPTDSDLSNAEFFVVYDASTS